MDSSYLVNLIVLEKDFHLRYEANVEFLPKVNDITIRKAIKQFQVNIDNAIKHLDHLYCCYSCFINLAQLKHISDQDPIVMAVFDIDILYHYDFNYYCHLSKSFDFCFKC